VGCFTWRGALVTIKSPTEVYRAKVVVVDTNGITFSENIWFDQAEDIPRLTRSISNIVRECIRKAKGVKF